jgi:hypothetical protein
MRIGIDVNGVLRDTLEKFDQLYEKHMIEKQPDEVLGQTYELDMSGNTSLIESDVTPFEYKKISDVTSLNLIDHYSFKSNEELFSFLYEEYAMEVFGHAPSTEMTTFNILNDLYFELRDDNELLIVSNEIGKSKPSTLFFLSKFGCLLEKVLFFSEITKNNMWKEIDVLLTANPDLLLEKPQDKIVIKFETIYNKQIESEYSISSLSEFSEILKTIKENVIYNLR